MKGRRMLVGVLVLGLLLSLAGLSPVSAGPETRETNPRSLHADFNGDGFGDLAIGVPYERLDAGVAGGVNVLFGWSSGLSSDFDQFWDQDMISASHSWDGDRFGAALAAGDFDGDGYVDLAVGVPYDDTSIDDVGWVNVIYGSGGGFSGGERWIQGYGDVQDTAQAGDRFGSALAVGDFNGDGYDDLAIGAPYEDLYDGTFDTRYDAGAVNVLYGSSGGLTAADDQFLYQGGGIQGLANHYELFGYALTAGDFNGNGYDDLAIGVPGDSDDSGAEHAGVVNVVYGGPNGLTAGNHMWHQGVAGVENGPEPDDRFGQALTAGDLNGDGCDDLVVGIPLEDIFVPFVTTIDAGAVQVLYGSSSGLTATGSQFWDQRGLGSIEANDQFGFALVTGDFDGDDYADLAIGVPYEDLEWTPTITDAGIVIVMVGSSGGLTAAGYDTWYQDSYDVGDEPEDGDRFGYALTAGDFDGDDYADLVVGVPYEDLEYTTTTYEDAGVVHVKYGSSDGLTFGTGNQLWHQDVYGVNETAEDGERFGYALAALVPERHRVYLPAVLRNS